MILVTNTNYRVTAEGFILVAFTNDRLKKQIEEIGFTNVQVSGSGSKRIASGHWPHPTQEKELPKAVASIIKKIESV